MMTHDLHTTRLPAAMGNGAGIAAAQVAPGACLVDEDAQALLEEECAALSQQNGWTPAYSEGYVNGRVARLAGLPLSGYLKVGRDLYALGFRCGYFRRQSTSDGTDTRHEARTGMRRKGAVSKAA